jgi:hypothetical protein
MVPAVIVIANAVAYWPGRAAVQLNQADVLRAGYRSQACSPYPHEHAHRLAGGGWPAK